MKKIYIDAGHGGSDPGASAAGLVEKNITLAIALKLRDVLKREYSGHGLRLSRTTDITKTLTQRTNEANAWKADYLLSIHINAGGGTGFESYIYNGNYENKQETNRLRQTIHNHIVQTGGFRDRGKKQANFHMLRESAMPSVLTENGFIDGTDADNLAKATFLQQVAKGHAKGLAKALSLESKSSKQYHIVKAGNTFWSISQTYRTTVAILQKLNPGVDPRYLQVGQKIRVA